MIIRENQIEQHLKSISTADWKRFFNSVENVRSSSEKSQMGGLDENEDGSINFPYVIKSEPISNFFDLVYELGFIIDFDWGNWNEGKVILNNPTQNFDELDLPTLCKLISTIVRADKFNEGFLDSCFEDGRVQKIVASMKRKLHKE